MLLLKRIFAALTLVLLATQFSIAQKYAPQQLKEDLDFIQHQLFAVQANPFTELDRQQYTKVFAGIRTQLKDSMTIRDFYRLVKPTISWISDEHAGISLPEGTNPFADSISLLPVSLKKQGSSYSIDLVLGTEAGVTPGTIVRKINHSDLGQLVKVCAGYTTGFPSQREAKAEKFFGYLYGLAYPPAPTYTLTLDDGREVTVKGAPIAAWTRYINNTLGTGNSCPQMVTYRKSGNTGYIDACSFATHNDKEYEAVSHTIDSIYALVQQDNIAELIIDVSHNSGGNSAVGDLLIAGFCDKPYRTYQCNWRRSDEYLKTIRGWGVQNPQYEQLKPGDILHYDSDTVFPRANGAPFKGNVYVLVGEGTFSSAIMFATMIKDNHLAPLVGVTPPDGHPTHFGEMYSATVPHTRLAIRFGVKEWIRPAGKTTDNILVPDIPTPIRQPVDIGQLIEVIHTTSK